MKYIHILVIFVWICNYFEALRKDYGKTTPKTTVRSNQLRCMKHLEKKPIYMYVYGGPSVCKEKAFRDRTTKAIFQEKIDFHGITTRFSGETV